MAMYLDPVFFQKSDIFLGPIHPRWKNTGKNNNPGMTKPQNTAGRKQLPTPQLFSPFFSAVPFKPAWFKETAEEGSEIVER